MRIFLTTGMMGGLTTFSTFSYETLYKAFMRQPAGAVSISRHVKIYYKKMAYAHY
jgi:fluoride ion exporter CrcB/FEX